MVPNKIPMISLCMIVKNEEQLLPSCLNSVKDLVDEIIVVDTGSTDKTIEIAKSFGAKIFFFEWVNDFAAARTESLKYATKEWILVLDADELIDEQGKSQIRELLKNASTKNHVGFGIISRHYTNDITHGGWQRMQNIIHANISEDHLLTNFNGYYDDKWKTRIFLNDKHIFYQGKIHEDVNPSIIAWDKIETPKIILNTPIIIHHFHFVKNQDFIQEKQKRYFELTKEEIRQHPSKKLYIDLAVGDLYFDNNLSAALDALTNAVKLETVLSDQEHEHLSKYISEKNTHELLTFLLDKLNYDHLDQNIIVNLIKAFFVKEYYQETETMLDIIISKLPLLSEEQFLQEVLGVTKSKLGKNKEAIGLFSSLHKRFPKHDQYIINLAALYEKDKQYDSAIGMFSILTERKHPQSEGIKHRIELLKKVNTYI